MAYAFLQNVPSPGLPKQKVLGYNWVPRLHAHCVWTLWGHVWDPQWFLDGFGSLQNLCIARDFEKLYFYLLCLEETS